MSLLDKHDWQMSYDETSAVLDQFAELRAKHSTENAVCEALREASEILTVARREAFKARSERRRLKQKAKA